MGFWFTEHDAYRILLESEDKPDFNGKNIGHAISRHVNISRQKLSDRMFLGEATKDGIPVYTAFTSVADQAKAVAAAINSPSQEAVMNRFFHPDRVKPGERRQLIDVSVSLVTPVRMAVSGDGPVMRPSTFVTVRLSKFPSRHCNIHIETAFAGLTPSERATILSSQTDT